MINIFFDKEFTELEEERARLISIGLVDESGDHRFYAELTDTWQLAHCSKGEFRHNSLLKRGTGIDAYL